MMSTLVLIMVALLCTGTTVSHARSSKLKTRVNVVESRVSTLEMRLTMETAQLKEDWVEVMDTLFELNQTVSGLAGECASLAKYPGQTNEDTDMPKEAVELLKGFKNEKRWVRNEISRVNDIVKVFEQNIAKSDEFEIENLVENVVAEKLKTALSEYKTEMLEHIDQYNDRVKNKFDKLSIEQNENFEKQQQSIVACNKQQLDTEDRLTYLKKGLEKKINNLVCPDDWVSYDKFCYQFFPKESTFFEAQTECAKVAASFVDIQDIEEMNFVESLAGSKNLWIGLTKSFWKWGRKNPAAQFTNWADGNPQGGADCVYAYSAYSYKWFDIGCSRSSLPFVCKKPRQHI